MKYLNIKNLSMALFASSLIMFTGCDSELGDPSNTQLVGSDGTNTAPVAVSPGDQVIILETEDRDVFIGVPSKTSQKSDALNEKGNAIQMAPMASENEVVVRAGEIYLDASKSYDPDGDSLTFHWTLISKPERSTLDLSNITSAEDAIEEIVLGDYVFGLVVSDGELSSPQVTFKVSLKVYKVETISFSSIYGDLKPSFVEKGTEIQQAISFYGDGNATYTYNEYGDMLTAVINSMYDNYKNTYTYDANGNRLTQESDYGNDGTVDMKLTYTYDANDNRLTEEFDYNNDGTVNQKNTYTYDANGNRLTEEYDYNNDGTVNQKNTYTYDANGNRLTEESDFNNDGTVNRKVTYTYDGNGNRLTEEYDHDNDGTVDQKNTYTYDANGNRLTEEYDYNNDGTVDYSRSYTYTYDTNGNILTEEFDDGNDGTIEYKITFTYDANGNEIKREAYDPYQDVIQSTEDRSWILLP